MPVEGAEYKVHLFKSGRVGMANGNYYPGIDLSIEPTLSSGQAINTATADLELSSPSGESHSAELVVLPLENGGFVLAWKTLVFAEEPLTDWLYFIDARTGAILEKKNRIMDAITPPDVTNIERSEEGPPGNIGTMPFVTGTGKVYPTHPGISSVTTENLYRLSGNGRLQGTYAYVLNDDGSEAYSGSHSFQYSTGSTHFDEANLYYHVDNFRHNFIAGLGSLGFTQITAHAHATHTVWGDLNAWFSPGNQHIYFGDAASSGSYNNFAREDKVVHHEYGHAVIYDIQSGIESDNNEEGAISEGTPDYFAGSFTGRPVIGDYVGSSRDMSDPEIDSYSEYQSESPVGAHAGGEFFSSILWGIRNNAGISAAQTDYLVFEALDGITGSPDFLDFRDAMMTADDAAYSGAHNDLIQDAFASKGVGQYATVSTPTNVTITNPTSIGNPDIDWDDNPENNIDYYEVWRQKKRVSDGVIFPEALLASPTSSSYTDTNLFMDPMPNDYDLRYAVKAVNTNSKESNLSGYTQWVNGISQLKQRPEITDATPEKFALQQNYPNPFNPSTQVKFALPEQASVTIQVYNIMGRQVATLSNKTMQAGFHQVEFDGSGLSSGVYIARMQAVGTSGKAFTDELKMQLIK